MIARQFELGADSVTRHARNHLPISLLEGAQAREAVHGDDLISELRMLQYRANAIAVAAEARGTLTVALLALKEQRELVALRARLYEMLILETRLARLEQDSDFAPTPVDPRRSRW